MTKPQQSTTSRSSQSPQRRGRIYSTRFSPSWTAEMWRFSMSVPFLLGDADIRQLVIRKAERRLRLGELRAAGGRSEEHTSELQSLMRISYSGLCLTNTKN